MSKPLVSILMGCYNRSAILPRVIDCLRAQTYDRWELILVDDCSTDASYRIARAYSDNRIIVLRNERNLGPFPTLNRAFTASAGELIAINDSDDLSHPRRLELQATALTTTPSLDALYTWYDVRTRAGALVESHRPPFTYEGLLIHLPIFNVIAHSTLMMRRTLWTRIGGYRTDLRYSSDWHLLLDIAQCAKIIPIRKTLVTCTRDTDNITVIDGGAMDSDAQIVAAQRFTTLCPRCPRTRYQRIFMWRFTSPWGKLLWLVRVIEYKTRLLFRYLIDPPAPARRPMLFLGYARYIITLIDQAPRMGCN